MLPVITVTPWINQIMKTMIMEYKQNSNYSDLSIITIIGPNR